MMNAMFLSRACGGTVGAGTVFAVALVGSIAWPKFMNIVEARDFQYQSVNEVERSLDMASSQAIPLLHRRNSPIRLTCNIYLDLPVITVVPNFVNESSCDPTTSAWLDLLMQLLNQCASPHGTDPIPLAQLTCLDAESPGRNAHPLLRIQQPVATDAISNLLLAIQEIMLHTGGLTSELRIDSITNEFIYHTTNLTMCNREVALLDNVIEHLSSGSRVPNDICPASTIAPTSSPTCAPFSPLIGCAYMEQPSSGGGFEASAYFYTIDASPRIRNGEIVSCGECSTTAGRLAEYADACSDVDINQVGNTSNTSTTTEIICEPPDTQFQGVYPFCLLKSLKEPAIVQTTSPPPMQAPSAPPSFPSPSSSPTMLICAGIPTGLGQVIRTWDFSGNLQNGQVGGQISNCKGIEAYLWDDTNYSLTGFDSRLWGVFRCNESKQMVELYIQVHASSELHARAYLSQHFCTMASVYASMGLAEHFQVYHREADCGLHRPCTPAPTQVPTATPTAIPTSQPSQEPSTSPSPSCRFNLQCVQESNCWMLVEAETRCTCESAAWINKTLQACNYSTTVMCNETNILFSPDTYPYDITNLFLMHQQCSPPSEECLSTQMCPFDSVDQACTGVVSTEGTPTFVSQRACEEVAQVFNDAVRRLVDTNDVDGVNCPCVDHESISLHVVVDQSTTIPEGHFEQSILSIESSVQSLADANVNNSVYFNFWTFDEEAYRVVPQIAGLAGTQDPADFTNLMERIGTRQRNNVMLQSSLQQVADEVLNGSPQQLPGRILVLVSDGQTNESCGFSCVQEEIQRFISAGWMVVVISVVDHVQDPQTSLEMLQSITNPPDTGYWNNSVSSWTCPSGTCGTEIYGNIPEGTCQTLFVQPLQNGVFRPGIVSEGLISHIIRRAKQDILLQLPCATALPTASPQSSSPTVSPTTCTPPEVGFVDVGLQLLVDQSGSISDGDLATSLQIAQNTIQSILVPGLNDTIFVSMRTFDVQSYPVVPDAIGVTLPMPATRNRADFDNLASKIVRLPNQGTAIRRALQETADVVLNSEMQNLPAKVLILVSDGQTLETCGLPDRIGTTDNCVEAEIQRFIQNNWTVVVVAVVGQLRESTLRQSLLEHLQRITNPLDTGYWNGSSWVCPSGICDISGNADPGQASTDVTLGTRQTLFLQFADTRGGLVSFALVYYALGLAIQETDPGTCLDRRRRFTTVTCVPGTDNCHECNADNSLCLKCRNQHYLHEGRCLAMCPTGYLEVGTGNFKRRCLEAAACTPRVDHCHECNANRTACLKCRDARYLHEGVCIAQCPTGFNGVGRGSYKRICRSAISGACNPRQDRCHECVADRTACAFCRERFYLHNGVCIRRCPNGFVEVGNGKFRRRCISNTTYHCTPRVDHCHECTADRSNCTKCRDRQYLHNGQCVPRCPLGYIPLGRGNYNRVCNREYENRLDTSHDASSLNQCLSRSHCPYPQGTAANDVAYPDGIALRLSFEEGCGNGVVAGVNGCDECHRQCNLASVNQLGNSSSLFRKVSCHVGCDCYYNRARIRHELPERHDCLLQVHEALSGARCVVCANRTFLSEHKCEAMCPLGTRPYGRESDCLGRKCIPGDCDEEVCFIE